MRYGRILVQSPDGAEARIVASGDGGSTWVDIRRSIADALVRDGATRQAARAISTALAPESLSMALAGGTQFRRFAQDAVDDAHESTIVKTPTFTNAIDPTSYRDFMVFEEHFSFGYRWQNKQVPHVMYEIPISYAGDPRSFIGTGETIPWPSYTRRLDYELELGIVIGSRARNVSPENALEHVLGLTILNDVSARDIQAREMTGGLGPSKGKHFACVTGPFVTSLDELPQTLGMRARVNGELLCDTTSDQMVWSVAEIVSWASHGETLLPGTLLGSGTCNGGSTIEIGHTLQPGDIVELEIDHLGATVNPLGEPEAEGWLPAIRERHADGTARRLTFLT